MPSAQYNSEYPNLPFDSKYRDFISRFYEISDTPDLHDEYAASFAENGRLQMASKEVHGTEGA